MCDVCGFGVVGVVMEWWVVGGGGVGVVRQGKPCTFLPCNMPCLWHGQWRLEGLGMACWLWHGWHRHISSLLSTTTSPYHHCLPTCFTKLCISFPPSLSRSPSGGGDWWSSCPPPASLSCHPHWDRIPPSLAACMLLLLDMDIWEEEGRTAPSLDIPIGIDMCVFNCV